MTALAVNRPFGISLLVVLYDIGALFGILGGVLTMALGGALGLAGAATGGFVAMTAGFFTLAWCLGVLVMGHFLWKGYRWARIGFIVLLAFATLFQLQSVAVAASKLIPLLMLAVHLLFLLILTGRQAKEFCAL